MKISSNKPAPEGDTNRANAGSARLRRRIQIVAAIIGLLLLGALARSFLPAGPRSPVPTEAVGAHAQVPDIQPITSGGAVVAERNSSVTRVPAPNPSPALRELVDHLVVLEATGGVWTDELTAAWKRNLQQLIQQGAGAVPAIREFLAKNVDFDFGEGGIPTLGYASARSVMIDALAQIGGPAAQAAMTDVLQTTGDPKEIATLAQSLEKLDPGRHQQQALDAARRVLETAIQGNLQGADVAPLFEVMRQYGGPNVASELGTMANRWDYYSAISLARLPDGAGIPLLVQLAEEQSGASPGARAVALQMLAQVATQSPDARAALVEQVRQGKLTAFNWIGLEALLAGNELVFQNPVIDNPLGPTFPSDFKQTHVPFGNQSFYTAPLGALTVDQIDQRRGLIEELFSATSDPVAIRTLEQAKAELSQRLLQLTASSK
jgi:HEAT repeat protein